MLIQQFIVVLLVCTLGEMGKGWGLNGYN